MHTCMSLHITGNTPSLTPLAHTKTPPTPTALGEAHPSFLREIEQAMMLTLYCSGGLDSSVLPAPVQAFVDRYRLPALTEAVKEAILQQQACDSAPQLRLLSARIRHLQNTARERGVKQFPIVSGGCGVVESVGCEVHGCVVVPTLLTIHFLLCSVHASCARTLRLPTPAR